MPRTIRITCVGCDKVIDGGSAHGCSNGVFRFFLSARSLKRVSMSDSACRKCRWKFDNWTKKLNGELSDLLRLGGTDDIMVSTN